jgi:hypothetical protein
MRSHAFIIFVLLLASTSSLAAQPTTAGIAVRLEGVDMDWRYADASLRSTRLNSAAVGWYDVLGANFLGGMYLGYVEGTQGDNPVPAARVMTGKWLEIDFQYLLINQPTVGLNISLDYRYTEMNGTMDTQLASWRWHQGSLGTTLRLGPARGVNFTLGLAHQAIDGEQILTGPLTQVENFTANKHLATQIGLNIGLDHTGRISIEMHTGVERGGRVTFGRWF